MCFVSFDLFLGLVARRYKDEAGDRLLPDRLFFVGFRQKKKDVACAFILFPIETEVSFHPLPL